MSEARHVDGLRERVLEVEDLYKEFPLKHSKDKIHAVNGVSFRIARGETLALIGESGSGKTTVGRCILRLLEPTSGKVGFRGGDIMRASNVEMRRLRSRLQLVFQEPYESLNPRMKIGAILEEPLKLARTGRLQRGTRVHELTDLVQLERATLAKYPHEISGGEQQRVGIARALATDPDLVVLDEPTSALDVALRAEILDLLAELQRRLGTAYLFISHDLTAVRAVSHRIAVMYLGRIVEEARTEDLFQAQSHPYSRALLASVLMPTPDIPLEPVGLAGEIPSPIHLPPGCHLRPRCPFAIDRCATDSPPLAAVTDTEERRAACWRARDVLGESSPVPEFDYARWKEEPLEGDRSTRARAT